jgi:hypothetical protein
MPGASWKSYELPELTHALARWLDRDAHGELSAFSAALMRRSDDPLLFTVGAALMRALAAVGVAFDVAHVRLLVEGVAANLSFDGPTILVAVGAQYPNVAEQAFVHFCARIRQAFADGACDAFTDECRALADMFANCPLQLDVSPIADSDLDECLIDFAPVIVAVITSGGDRESFVGALIKTAHDADR